VPRPGRIPRTTERVLPLLALLAVCGLDAVLSARAWPVPVVGLLDEPAHLLTAWLALAALGPGSLRTPAGVAPWVLAGSVLLDVDHVPLYLWGEPVAEQGSRPVTHSAVTIGVLLLLAAALRNRPRTAALGLAAGAALHLVRDVVSGPGIPLLWPLDPVDVRLPYGVYLAVLAGAAALASVRAAPGQRNQRPMNERR
jgi:inner membrane protein